MDEADEPTETLTTDRELRQMLGLFDMPAFARRGQELEYALGRLHARCARERKAMLEMVRVRLRQWAALAVGPDDVAGAFAGPIAPLWPLADAEPPTWAASPAPARRRRAVARDLVASIERFNRRWEGFTDGLPLGPINAMIERYNRYYLLEKECTFGSARLAARGFRPRPTLKVAALREEYPTLPVPDLLA